MNNFTDKNRIEQFSKLMDSYVPKDFKKVAARIFWGGV